MGAAVFAVLGFAYVATISSVGVSHPHAPPAILVGVVAAIYSAPVGLLLGLILGAMKQKSYKRLLVYIIIGFVLFAAFVTLALRPK